MSLSELRCCSVTTRSRNIGITYYGTALSVRGVRESGVGAGLLYSPCQDAGELLNSRRIHTELVKEQ